MFGLELRDLELIDSKTGASISENPVVTLFTGQAQHHHIFFFCVLDFFCIIDMRMYPLEKSLYVFIIGIVRPNHGIECFKFVPIKSSLHM